MISRGATHELVRGKNPSCVRSLRLSATASQASQAAPFPAPCPVWSSPLTHSFSPLFCINASNGGLARKMSQLAVTFFGALAVASRAELAGCITRCLQLFGAKAIIRQHLTCVTFSHLGMLSLEHTAVTTPAWPPRLSLIL